jgi:starch synthase (maltosyl-transferring)
LILAATLGASYGIYSGFELCDNRAVPGTEEYQDSEKYQIRHWDWNRPGHIKELVARVNAIRRSHPALQSDGSLRFLATDNPQIIAYCKDGTAAGSAETIMVVVNLDPHHLQHGFVQGPATDRSYLVEDLLTGTSYMWRSEWNYVRLDPGVNQGHVFAIGAERRAQRA